MSIQKVNGGAGHRFLQCREEWLAELVRELDDSNVYEYVKRLTDVHRLQLFDVVMQFRAIFSDDSSPQEAASGGGGNAAPDAGNGGAVYSWAQHRLCVLLWPPSLSVCSCPCTIMLPWSSL